MGSKRVFLNRIKLNHLNKKMLLSIGQRIILALVVLSITHVFISYISLMFSPSVKRIDLENVSVVNEKLTSETRGDTNQHIAQRNRITTAQSILSPNSTLKIDDLNSNHELHPGNVGLNTSKIQLIAETNEVVDNEDLLEGQSENGNKRRVRSCKCEIVKM